MTQITGTGPQVVAQDLFAESSTAQHDLGELVHSADGRTFRYVKAGGTALVAGKLQQCSAQDTGDQDIAIAAASAGATAIVTTGTVTVTENQYAGGYLITSDDTGEGYTYHISGHAAATAAVVTINISDALEEALTTSTTIDLVKNPFDSVVVYPTSITSAVAGVAIKDITASYFGWLQVGGTVAILADSALTVGLPVVASNGVAGAVSTITDGADELLPEIGVAITGVADTEYGAVLLNLL